MMHTKSAHKRLEQVEADNMDQALPISCFVGPSHNCRPPQGHFEAPPYQNDSMRSAYHVRELDVYRLLQLARPVDVGLSHDWPRGIARHGDTAQLFRAKSFLRREVWLCGIEHSSIGHSRRLTVL